MDFEDISETWKYNAFFQNQLPILILKHLKDFKITQFQMQLIKGILTRPFFLSFVILSSMEKRQCLAALLTGPKIRP